MTIQAEAEATGPRWPVAIIAEDAWPDERIADLPADPLARAAMEARVEEWWAHLPLHSKMGCHYYAILMAEQLNGGPLPVLDPS
jgi:hypothetical protein